MGATTAMIVLSSPATLTGAEEKKTGPSRFNEDFSGVTLDPMVKKQIRFRAKIAMERS
jgi:hypothetical protein